MAPTAAKWTSLVVAFLSAALYFYAHVHRESGEAWARYVEIITKPVPVLACMVVVLTRDVAPHAVRYARFVVVGLGFSVLGDVCLLFASLFLPGVAFFLVGHIMFVFAFRSGVRLPRSVLLYVPFALHACCIAYFVTPYTEDAIMATASIVYTLVIGFMTYSAWSRVGLKTPNERLVSQLIGALGATFFMTSDTLLAFDRWVTPIEGCVRVRARRRLVAHLGVRPHCVATGR